MDFSEFAIGTEFWCSGHKHRCTDIGTRVVIAIRIHPIERTTFDTISRTTTTETITLEQAEADGCLDGPPYIVAETVFDEDDQEACELTEHPPDDWDDAAGLER